MSNPHIPQAAVDALRDELCLDFLSNEMLVQALAAAYPHLIGAQQGGYRVLGDEYGFWHVQSSRWKYVSRYPTESEAIAACDRLNAEGDA